MTRYFYPNGHTMNNLIGSRSVVAINPLTPSKSTIQLVFAELYFNWVCLQQITWHKILIVVPHFKPETNTKVPFCPAICIHKKQRGPYSPTKRPYQKKSTTLILYGTWIYVKFRRPHLKTGQAGRRTSSPIRGLARTEFFRAPQLPGTHDFTAN